MSDRVRIGIVFVSALVLGVTTFVHHPGVGHPAPELGQAGVLVPYALAVVGAFLVDRWWALLPALSTTVVLWAVAGHDNPGPWAADPGVPPVLWPLIVFQTMAPTLGLLLLGLLARRVRDRSRGSNLLTTITKGG